LDTYKQRGYEAMIIAPTSPSPKYLGFPVVRTASVALKQFQVGIPPIWLQNTIQEFAPDVVHVASPFFLGGQAILAAERLGIPTVAVYQTELSGYAERYNLQLAKPILDKLMASIHAPATVNLAPTPQTGEYLRALGVGDVAIWGRGVDLDLYHPNLKFTKEVHSLKQEWAPNGEIIIGYVGRLAPEKQVHRMAELAEVPNTRFVVVGEGPERAQLEQQFRNLSVTFTGRLIGPELANAYAAFDVFVHFGTEETFGQTIQEAQASGLPVVAPASGGPLTLIDHGLSGYLVHPALDHGFNQTVANLVIDEPLRARIGEQARRSVLNKSWEANNANLVEHYKNAIQLQRGRLQLISPEVARELA
jgi:phosphatidylinositol alpha 1,6-mannosyltransferase